MNEAYWRSYKCNGDDISHETIGVEAEVEIKIGH